MKAEVRSVNGIPELFINDRLSSRMAGRLELPGEMAPYKLVQYMDAGIEVFFTSTDSPCTLYWDGLDGYDYAPYEWHIGRILDKKPDAKLILYVGCGGGAPYLWNKAHPDEMALLPNGDRLSYPSLASEIWLQDSNRAMARFVQHFEQSRFAENIIGYNPHMYAYEWLTPFLRKDPLADDYSGPMKRRFRQWLKDKYEEDVERLRMAWKDAQVTFENAEIPDPDQRYQTAEPEALVNFEGPCGWKTADFHQCYWETMAHAAVAYCRTIKQALKVPKLTCMMHGNKPAAQILLESEWIDCLHAPYHYGNRKGCHYSGYSIESIRRHGKLYLDQTDTGTHVQPKTGGYQLGSGGLWSPPKLTDSKLEAVELLKRDIGYALANNYSCYWNEGGPGWMFPIVPHGVPTWSPFWYDDPALKQVIGDLKRLIDENQRHGAENAAEVAILYSQDFEYFVPPGSTWQQAFGFPVFQQMVMSRVGVPFDRYLLEDFEQIDRSYKLYIFPHSLYIPEHLSEKIKSKLKTDRATAVWMYGSGYVSESGVDLKRVRHFTGLNMSYDAKPETIQVDLTAEDHPFFAGLSPEEKTFGSASLYKMNPVMALDDKDNERLSVRLPGTFWAETEEDGATQVLGRIHGTEKAGLVSTEHEGYRSVWIGAPQPPAGLIRNITAKAGVHIYAETGDLIYASSRYVVLYCRTSGRKTIKLPGIRKVHEVFGKKTPDGIMDQIDFSGDAGETFIFRTE